jgi:hypothetical protein
MSLRGETPATNLLGSDSLRDENKLIFFGSVVLCAGVCVYVCAYLENRRSK